MNDIEFLQSELRDITDLWHRAQNIAIRINNDLDEAEDLKDSALDLLQQVSDFLDDYILVFHGDTGDEDKFCLALSAVLARQEGESNPPPKRIDHTKGFAGLAARLAKARGES